MLFSVFAKAYASGVRIAIRLECTNKTFIEQSSKKCTAIMKSIVRMHNVDALLSALHNYSNNKARKRFKSNAHKENMEIDGKIFKFNELIKDNKRG